MKDTFNRFLVWLGALGNLPTDSPEERLRKATLIYFGTFTGLAGFIWGALYFWLGSMFSGWIPLVYSFSSMFNLLYFTWRKKINFYRFTQLFMMLMLPFLLQWSLGGFVAASAVIIWAVAAPMIALMLHGPEQVMLWFVAFIALTILSGIFDPVLETRAVIIPQAVRIIFYVINIGAVSSVMYFLLRHFTRQRDDAQRRSEELLLNILPASIAERLMQEPGTIADGFNEVTVLFADIVEFTRLSSEADPKDVVQMLNRVFSDFDDLTEQHGLEKIKTIGDAYMVAGGLPEPREDHAEAVVEMAIQMLERLEHHEALNGESIQLRVGINTGSVVAGVIGRQKFIYDLWGDAVNTASRMESNGLANEIQVTRETYERVKDRYEFEEREPIYVKGKGEMVTYLLKGRVARG